MILFGLFGLFGLLWLFCRRSQNEHPKEILSMRRNRGSNCLNLPVSSFHIIYAIPPYHACAQGTCGIKTTYCCRAFTISVWRVREFTRGLLWDFFIFWRAWKSIDAHVRASLFFFSKVQRRLHGRGAALFRLMPTPGTTLCAFAHLPPPLCVTILLSRVLLFVLEIK